MPSKGEILLVAIFLAFFWKMKRMKFTKIRFSKVYITKL